MCFSAEASFATGLLLLPAGVYCMRAAAARNHGLRALAITPAIFAIQQFCEGFVWLGLRRGDADLVRSAALAFLFFALVFWPTWIPLVAMCCEWRRHRRRARFCAAGAVAAFAVSSFVYLPLLNAREWLHVDVALHSIRYEFDALAGFRWLPREFWQAAYVATVTIPLVVLPHRSLRIFGLLIAASAVLAHVAFWYAYVSVWCAFAALLSAWLCRMFATLPTGLGLGSVHEPAHPPTPGAAAPGSR
jgi:hypothetical protein